MEGTEKIVRRNLMRMTVRLPQKTIQESLEVVQTNLEMTAVLPNLKEKLDSSTDPNNPMM